MDHYISFGVNDNDLMSFEQENELLNKYKIDLYDGRAEAHMRSLINGYGSTSEGLVNAFVKGDYKAIIKESGSIEAGWDRIDAYQKHLVMCFRVLMYRGFRFIPAEGEDFIQYFKRKCCETEFNKLVETDEITIEESISMADKACQTVFSAIGDNISKPYKVMVYNEEQEEFFPQ
jgi:hypothetical protein